jgi:hypothetical protein
VTRRQGYLVELAGQRRFPQGREVLRQGKAAVTDFEVCRLRQTHKFCHLVRGHTLDRQGQQLIIERRVNQAPGAGLVDRKIRVVDMQGGHALVEVAFAIAYEVLLIRSVEAEGEVGTAAALVEIGDDRVKLARF